MILIKENAFGPLQTKKAQVTWDAKHGIGTSRSALNALTDGSKTQQAFAFPFPIIAHFMEKMVFVLNATKDMILIKENAFGPLQTKKAQVTWDAKHGIGTSRSALNALTDGSKTQQAFAFPFPIIAHFMEKMVFVLNATKDMILIKENAFGPLQTKKAQVTWDAKHGIGTSRSALNALTDGSKTQQAFAFPFPIIAHFMEKMVFVLNATKDMILIKENAFGPLQTKKAQVTWDAKHGIGTSRSALNALTDGSKTQQAFAFPFPIIAHFMEKMVFVLNATKDMILIKENAFGPLQTKKAQVTWDAKHGIGTSRSALNALTDGSKTQQAFAFPFPIIAHFMEKMVFVLNATKDMILIKENAFGPLQTKKAQVTWDAKHGIGTSRSALNALTDGSKTQQAFAFPFPIIAHFMEKMVFVLNATKDMILIKENAFGPLQTKKAQVTWDAKHGIGTSRSALNALTDGSKTQQAFAFPFPIIAHFMEKMVFVLNATKDMILIKENAFGPLQTKKAQVTWDAKHGIGTSRSALNALTDGSKTQQAFAFPFPIIAHFMEKMVFVLNATKDMILIKENAFGPLQTKKAQVTWDAKHGIGTSRSALNALTDGSKTQQAFAFPFPIIAHFMEKMVFVLNATKDMILIKENAFGPLQTKKAQVTWDAKHGIGTSRSALNALTDGSKTQQAFAFPFPIIAHFMEKMVFVLNATKDMILIKENAFGPLQTKKAQVTWDAKHGIGTSRSALNALTDGSKTQQAFAFPFPIIAHFMEKMVFVLNATKDMILIKENAFGPLQTKKAQVTWDAKHGIGTSRSALNALTDGSKTQQAFAFPFPIIAHFMEKMVFVLNATKDMILIKENAFGPLQTKKAQVTWDAKHGIGTSRSALNALTDGSKTQQAFAFPFPIIAHFMEKMVFVLNATKDMILIKENAFGPLQTKKAQVTWDAKHGIGTSRSALNALTDGSKTQQAFAFPFPIIAHFMEKMVFVLNATKDMILIKENAFGPLQTKKAQVTWDAKHGIGTSRSALNALTDGSKTQQAFAFPFPIIAHFMEKMVFVLNATKDMILIKENAFGPLQTKKAQVTWDAKHGIGTSRSALNALTDGSKTQQAFAFPFPIIAHFMEKMVFVLNATKDMILIKENAFGPLQTKKAQVTWDAKHGIGTSRSALNALTDGSKTQQAFAFPFPIIAHFMEKMVFVLNATKDMILIKENAFGPLQTKKAQVTWDAKHGIGTSRSALNALTDGSKTQQAFAFPFPIIAHFMEKMVFVLNATKDMILIKENAFGPLQTKKAQVTWDAKHGIGTSRSALNALTDGSKTQQAFAFPFPIIAHFMEKMVFVLNATKDMILIKENAFGPLQTKKAQVTWDAKHGIGTSRSALNALTDGSKTQQAFAFPFPIIAHFMEKMVFALNAILVIF